MHAVLKMRDRRNTNISISSHSSTSSTSPTPSRSSLNEKRLSWPSSPTLPEPATITTKENTPKVLPRRMMVLRTVVLIAGVVLLCRYAPLLLHPIALSDAPDEDSPFELSGGDQLPPEPTALVVSGGLPEPQWTVAIPHNASFPLHGEEYEDICTQGDDLSQKLRQSSRLFWERFRRMKSGYHAQDPTFLDVADAEALGVLPKSQYDSEYRVCERSLTFAMDTEDASFGRTLLMLWMSYGLAKKEDRAFFIDDTRWPYGKYASYFKPPPSPDCSSPPPHQVLPCPVQSRHLVISAATAPWTFGRLFDDKFAYRRHHGRKRNHGVYALAHTGYKALFRLVGEDASYARARASSLKEDAVSHSGAIVGIQIRRGDLHPFEYQFSRDYLPLERYAKAARSLFNGLLRRSDDVDEVNTTPDLTHSPFLIASDDPDIFGNPELIQVAAPFTVQKAQDRIVLATKAALDRASPVQSLRVPGSAYIKHVDENSGWDGGFYSRLFYSVGNSKASDQRLRDGEDTVPEQAMKMRELVGRAYLIDLAVLGYSSDGIVCAVSSASCRILGVMLGWDAIEDGRWVNVDDRRPWSWDGRRREVMMRSLAHVA